MTTCNSPVAIQSNTDRRSMATLQTLQLWNCSTDKQITFQNGYFYRFISR